MTNTLYRTNITTHAHVYYAHFLSEQSIYFVMTFADHRSLLKWFIYQQLLEDSKDNYNAVSLCISKYFW